MIAVVVVSDEKSNICFVASSLGGVRSIVMSMSVCVFVRSSVRAHNSTSTIGLRLRRWTSENLHLSGSIIVAITTSGFNSDRTVRQYAHGLLLESSFVPFSTDHWGGVQIVELVFESSFELFFEILEK